MYTRKNEHWRLDTKLNIESEEELRHVVSGWLGCECVLCASPARFTKAASPARKCVGIKNYKKPHTHTGGVLFLAATNQI